MYPHTPPICGWFSIELYILHKASPSGRSPTSSKIVYLGEGSMVAFYNFENSLQNPLKNQLCEDNFCAFLYFITKNKFILIDNISSIYFFCKN